ncbi:ABC transporter permease [Aeromicrobium sp. A1-2]|uniref:ABC transporter permease n=1 Tax=Aeromicrobium sp. A1-2 TaxID=2107713 RepID=UPI000E557D74|nr:ABC transporter permease [Aeromicrobium sp. A1-2]AXT85512.1 ABC transporter permease [Aeromicrobium sp. A1-2]
MWWYVGKRLLQTIPVVLGATLLIYAMVFATPGDPITALFGDKPVSEGVANQLREQYNLNDPFIVQWAKFLWNALAHGDFGMSYTGRPVSEVVKTAFPVTIKLSLMALVIEMVLGILAGTIAGMRKGKLFDSTMLVTSLLVIAVPIFVFAFLLQLIFGVKLNWVSPTVGGDASFQRLILPAIVLGLVSFAYILRLTRNSVAENLSLDHVRTARAKGLSERRVGTVHVLRNSLIPVITFLGADLGALMAGAVVTEGIFNIPGVGNLAFSAIQRGETPTIVAIITIFVLVYVVTSLVVDLIYALLDPRIRYV